MATNEVLLKNAIAAAVLTFKSSVYSPTAINDIDPASSTTVDLTLDEGGTGLADAAAINSDQVDLGTTRADSFRVHAALEWFAAVTAGKTVAFYWSPSNNSVVSDGNPGKPDGVDGAWTGDGGGTVAETVLQLQYIGSFITTDLIGVQIAEIGAFSPSARYGQLIVINNSGTLLCGTDDIESAVVMEPIIVDIQAAA